MTPTCPLCGEPDPLEGSRRGNCYGCNEALETVKGVLREQEEYSRPMTRGEMLIERADDDNDHAAVAAYCD